MGMHWKAAAAYSSAASHSPSTVQMPKPSANRSQRGPRTGSPTGRGGKAAAASGQRLAGENPSVGAGTTGRIGIRKEERISPPGRAAGVSRLMVAGSAGSRRPLAFMFVP